MFAHCWLNSIRSCANLFWAFNILILGWFISYPFLRDFIQVPIGSSRSTNPSFFGCFGRPGQIRCISNRQRCQGVHPRRYQDLHRQVQWDIGPLIAQDVRGPARARGPEGLQVSILSSISSCILSGICV